MNLSRFMRDLWFAIVADLFLTGLLHKVVDKMWMTIAGGVVFVVIIFGLLYSRYERHLKVLWSGAYGYYYSFEPGENLKVWKEAKESFKYLGISGNSILELFRRWISEQNVVSDYCFLLMNPESTVIERQIVFEKGYALDTDLSSLPEDVRTNITSERYAVKGLILGTVKTLKNTMPYKEGRMKIRFYDEFAPYWMYVLDNNKIYLGILERGRRGTGCPVLVLKKHKDYTTQFDVFYNTWNRIWVNAKDA